MVGLAKLAFNYLTITVNSARYVCRPDPGDSDLPRILIYSPLAAVVTMLPISPEQERRLVDALIALDWMRTHDRKSCELICEQLQCSMAEAIEVLQYLHLKRNLIRAVDRKNEGISPGVAVPRYRWKWERNSE